MSAFVSLLDADFWLDIRPDPRSLSDLGLIYCGGGPVYI